MTFCIPKADAVKFIEAIKDGKIVPEKLMDMTSAERRAHFASIVGDNLAEGVNAAFESKMLLQDQKRGMVTWAKQVGGLSDRQKLDFIAKVNKLDKVLQPEDEKAFLADLAAQKLGATVTADEAKAIAKGAQLVTELKTQGWDEAGQKWANDGDRLKYGTAYTEYQDYVGDLLRDAKAPTFKEWIRSPKQVLLTTASATKGIVASMDNSYFGRQGIKMLFTNPGIWANGFVKSWGDMAKEVRGVDAMKAIRADIASRPNAMNGKYRNAKVALGLEFEEAFPSSLPEKIPLFGRLYKASEAAFNGGAMRLRADYADKMIALAEKSGVSMSRPGKQAEGIGALVNAMTGRGNLPIIGSGQSGAVDAINATFFSLRFLKSNVDTLTMHRLGYAIEEGPSRQFVRKQAAQNLMKIVGGMGAILFAAEQLWPGSVEWDPHSSNFGKIKIGNTRFDISGGMASLVTLASRCIPTMHNGRWSWWSKSSTSGKWTDLHAGKYGQPTALDVMLNFMEGKFSPSAGIVRDILKGETFGGQPVTLRGSIESLLTPIGFQTFQDALNDPKAAPLLAVVILDALGIGASTYSGQRKHFHKKSVFDALSSDDSKPAAQQQ